MPSRFASSVDMGPCQHGPCQPERFCKKSLLLLPVSSALLVAAVAGGGDAVARGYTHALQSSRAYRQSEATLSQTGKKQEVRSKPLSGEAWPIRSVRKVFGQQEAAVESHVDHIWLYQNILPKYDKLSHI